MLLQHRALGRPPIAGSPIITDLFPMEQANEALTYLAAGQSYDRIVLLTPAGQPAIKEKLSIDLSNHT
jgi:hypothetical protein